MDNEGIIEKVDQCISLLEKEFETHPNYFFTENDILCRLYQLLSDFIPDAYGEDVNRIRHRLIHTEHPTPFRCSMDSRKFELKTEGERTLKGGKFKRGHFDIAFLNPNAVMNLDYGAIVSQDYQIVKEVVLPVLTKENPLILYAIEIQYRRSPMKSVTAEDFIKMAVQDHMKLKAAACNAHDEYQFLNERYVKEYRSLVFISNNDREMVKVVKDRLEGHAKIQVIPAL